MPTNREILNAANKTPSNRTSREQQMVDDAKRAGNQAAKNADHGAQHTEKVWGNRRGW